MEKSSPNLISQLLYAKAAKLRPNAQSQQIYIAHVSQAAKYNFSCLQFVAKASCFATLF